MTQELWQSIKAQLPNDRNSPYTLLIWIADLALLSASWFLWIKTSGLWTHAAAEIIALFVLVQAFLIMHEASHGVVWRSKFVNDLVGHVCGWLIFLPFLPRQRNHHLHHAWAGHPLGDPETRRLAERFAAISQAETGRMEFTWRYWIPAIAFNSFLGNWLLPFRQRAAGDRSARTRTEIRFARIYLAGYFAVAVVALATHAGWPLLCWYVPVWVVQLIAVELLNLPHHLEAKVLPKAAPRLPYWEQDAVSHNCRNLPVWSRFVILNFNLHVTHHAFPAVPWYRLPQVHRILSHHGSAGETSGSELGWSIRKRRQPLLSMVDRTVQSFTATEESCVGDIARAKSGN